MEEITLENITDWRLAHHGHIEKTQIRRLTVEALPDTSAWTLVINEDIRKKLGLTIEKSIDFSLADGKTSNCPITESVRIQWKDRSAEIPAVVVAEAENVLLGALPLEYMDLIVDPVHKQLTEAHGDQPCIFFANRYR